MKTCTGCRRTLAVSEFQRDSSRKDGYNYRCKECIREYLASRRDKIADTRRRWAAKNRDHQQRWTYGLRAGEYDELLAQQGGGCAICGRAKSVNGRRLSVDHCHATGRVRGLLCSGCNSGLGFFQDDARLLLVAACYLDDMTTLLHEAGYGSPEDQVLHDSNDESDSADNQHADGEDTEDQVSPSADRIVVQLSTHSEPA